jgi:hypothetical protein
MYSSVHEKIHNRTIYENLKEFPRFPGCRRNVVDNPALPGRLRGVGWYLVTGLEMLNL